LKKLNKNDAKIAVIASNRNDNRQKSKQIKFENVGQESMLPPIDRNSGNKPKEIQNAYFSKETHEGQYKERLGQLNMPNAPILMERGPYK
jgi:hypothetical protein